MGTGENITKQDMRYLLPLETRWSDNDQYGHLNNAVYYQLFDTAVNRFLGMNTSFPCPLGDPKWDQGGVLRSFLRQTK